MKVGVILGSVLALLSSFRPAQADGFFIDGNQLLELCDTNRAAARMFILGASDTLLVWDTVAKDLRFHCLPKEVKDRQVVDAMCLALEKKPEIRHYSAATVIWSSIGEAFPCN